MQEVEADRILLVDDDQRLRQLLAEYLRESGFAITEAADGKQLMTALDRGHFDLIVLDLMLPGEDGLSLCRRLRGLGLTTPVLPRLGLTRVPRPVFPLDETMAWAPAA